MDSKGNKFDPSAIIPTSVKSESEYTTVGANTVIGNGVVLAFAKIGQDCHIGDNAKIIGAPDNFLEIESGTTIYDGQTVC